ncbi:Hypothetical predicted protein [Marmota monax]|uniref:Interleukin-20 receptor subunit alpha n=1 Tax=Marmota monax TaxID=9995 RepID=A0A5E4C1S8_MARMO|nr:Hypothetical predicted protein [Marmota monax]
MINFITLSLLDDSKIPQKDMSLLERSRDGSNLNDAESLGDPEPHPEEVETINLGYASHLMEIFCDSEENTKGTSLTQQESSRRTIAAGKAVVEYEYDVTTDICRGPEDEELCVQELVSTQGKLVEQQAALANLGPQMLLGSYTPRLSDLLHLELQQTGSEEGLEEEPSTTLVDWDPQTGRLCIPSLSTFDQDSQGCEHHEPDQLSEEGLLSRLYEKQAPGKPPEENENYLKQFMEEWGLYVQMEN